MRKRTRKSRGIISYTQVCLGQYTIVCVLDLNTDICVLLLTYGLVQFLLTRTVNIYIYFVCRPTLFYTVDRVLFSAHKL